MRESSFRPCSFDHVELDCFFQLICLTRIESSLNISFLRFLFFRVTFTDSIVAWDLAPWGTCSSLCGADLCLLSAKGAFVLLLVLGWDVVELTYFCGH